MPKEETGKTCDGDVVRGAPQEFDSTVMPPLPVVISDLLDDAFAVVPQHQYGLKVALERIEWFIRNSDERGHSPSETLWRIHVACHNRIAGPMADEDMFSVLRHMEGKRRTAAARVRPRIYSKGGGVR